MELFGENESEKSQGRILKAYESGKMPEVRFRRHGTIDPPNPGFVMMFASVTPRGELVTQWATPENAAISYERVVAENGVTYTPTMTSRPVRHVVMSGDHLVTIEESRHAAPLVQILSDGSLIQASVRASWTPEGGELNAGHYSPEGVLLHEACIGDGILEMYVDQQDRLWVGYFDEGICGNYGWGAIYDDATKEFHPTDAPIGAPGLNRFRADLSLDWEYPQEEHGIPFISDIYALNVGASSVWNSAYDDFGVTQITGDEVRVISSDGPAAAQLVTDGARFASVYPYGQPILNYGAQVQGGIEHRGIGILRSPDGGELGKAIMHARDGELFCVARDELWKVDIDEIGRLDRGAAPTWLV